jgi:hypothetical protein
MQITQFHLRFLEEATEVFHEDVRRETHINEDGDLIALRYGLDRDCVRIFALDGEVGFFAQMVGRKSKTPDIEAYGR